MHPTAAPWSALHYDPASGMFTLRSADDAVRLESLPALEVNGSRLTSAGAVQPADAVHVAPGESAVIPLELPDAGLGWELSMSLSADGDTALLSCRIINRGAAPVALGRCALVDVADGVGLAQLQGDDGNAVVLHQSATTGHCRVFRAAEAEPNMSRIMLHLVSHAAGRALHLGFVTLDRVTTFHEFDYEEGGGLTRLQAVCDFEGWELAAGGEVAAETLMIEARADLHASLHEWADRVAARYDPPIWPKIPGGWLGWAWVDGFTVERYEDVVMRNARAVRRRLPGFDIEYIWVSIGNIEDGMPGNWTEWDDTNFPHGHEWLVDELDKLGFKLGFWSGAFWISSALPDLVEELRDAMLFKDGEPLISCMRWNYGASAAMPPEQRPHHYSLDPTHPKAQAFLRGVFETCREWGVRYYMIDFLHAISGATPGSTDYDDYHDKSLIRSPQVYREGLRVVREAAGPETYLLSSSGPTIHNVGLMDACRVGNDYGEGRALYPHSYFYPATFVINAADFWTSHRHASDNMAANYYTHRKLYLNDAGNVMTVDKPIPVCEAQITATIFGLCGGPVMLGDDIDRISEERLALIKKVFPRTPQVAVPLDLFDAPAPDYPKLFHQRVMSDWGSWEVVGVLNYGDEPLTLDVPFAPLGLDPAQPQWLWEFWNEQYLGVATGQFRALVPPRSARLYRLTACATHPWVLSTDMHVMQGQVELADVAWDPAAMTLSGAATRPAGETGNIFIIAPKGLRVEAPAGWWIAKDAEDESLIIRGQLSFGEGPVEWSIGFAAL